MDEQQEHYKESKLIEFEEKFEKAGGEVKIPDLRALRHPNAEAIVAPVSGRVLWEVDFNDKSIAPYSGKSYKEGDTICHIQAPYGMEPVITPWQGKIVEAVAEQGKLIEKGDTIAYIEK